MKAPRPIALVLLAALCLTLGCLPTYVGDPTKAAIDPRLVGFWHKPEGDGKESLWAVHKMDEHCYLMQAYNFENDDAGKLGVQSRLIARAWTADVGGKPYISLELYTTGQLAKPNAPDAGNRYIVAQYALEGDTLTVRGVDADFVKSNNITTPKQFEAALKKAADTDDVFVEAAKYTRVKPGDDTLKRLLELAE